MRHPQVHTYRLYFAGVFLVCLFAGGCGNNTGTETSNDTGVHATADPVVGFAPSNPFVLPGCYEMTHKGDTATLQLSVQDSVVRGRLVYRWYQKDANTGTIKGVLRDSLILADYTFALEGLTSVRELILKIQDTVLVEAFGDLQTKGNKIVFANPVQVQYMADNPFVKVACDSLSNL